MLMQDPANNEPA